MPADAIMPGQHRFVKAVAQALRHRCRVSAKARVLVAVSGGADSIALLRALALLAPCRSWRLQLAVGHVQHHLRPEDQAEGDADFVAALARRLELPLFRADLDPHRLRSAGNLEAAARQARYQALGAMAAAFNAPFIATAHQADDQLETVLMRLLRGTSVRGLRGIAWRREISSPKSKVQNPKSKIQIPDPQVAAGTLDFGLWTLDFGLTLIRPMLALSRQDAHDFLRDLDQPWREDHTNADQARLRARLRQEVTPLLRRIRPDAAAKALALADHARLVTRLIDHAVGVAADRVLRQGDTLILDRVEARSWPALVLLDLLRKLLLEAGARPDTLTRRSLTPLLRAVGDTTGGRRRFAFSGGVQATVLRTQVTLARPASPAPPAPRTRATGGAAG